MFAAAERTSEPFPDPAETGRDVLDRLYRHLGQRYLAAIAFVIWMLAMVCGAGFVFGVAVPYPDQNVSAGETRAVLVLTETSLTLGALVTDGIWLRGARPVRAWIAGGRRPERAPEIWHLVVRLPLRFALLAFSAGVIFAALPLTLFGTPVLDLSGHETVFAFLGILAGGLYLTLFAYLLLEFCLRPVRRDLAARIPPGFRLDGPGMPLARRLLVVQVLIAGSAGASVTWALTLSDGSEERAAAGLALTTIAALTTTLGMAILFNRSFGEPIQNLMQATRSVKAGELLVRVPVLSDDEHGVLAGSFNEMAANLQRSREQRVAAREEERRRLRRDLHDGLGPTLAALAMRIEAAARLIPDDPEAAGNLLGQLRTDTAETIADVRRLVRGLRPPELDEFGLIGAIEQFTEQLHEAVRDELSVRIEAPPQLPPLPAAVEVAAYRIAQEAITNVARHSRARQCRVRVRLNSGLHLEVSDDGGGLSRPDSVGVGLTSMRERAAELGGSCAVQPRAGGGTVVTVRLPLPSPPA